MTDDLKSRTKQALIWSSLERFGPLGIQFVISIILARLLSPEEFGLVAMLAIFIAIAQSFIDSGFGQALIQKQDITYIDECSIFYFNIFMGCILTGILCLSAPFVAAFYQQPLLELLTYALSLNLIINAFGLVQTTLLTKNIDFKTQLKVSGVSTVISGIVGVFMALNGYGVWSIVAQSISGNILRTALLWFFNSWRPSLVISLSSLNKMFSFGSRLLLSGLLEIFFQNIYLVMIGKIYSAENLGFYTRAKDLQQQPVAVFSSMISRVTLPVFSLVQNDKPRLKRGVRKALTLLVMVNFPFMIGLAIVAKPLVIVLLTEKWLPCVPYLQLLCVVGMFYPLHVINLNVLIAQGRSDLYFRLDVIKRIVIIIAVIVTYRWGIIAMISGQIVTSFFAYLLNAYYTGKMLHYPIKEQVEDLVPCLALACLMGIGVYMFKFGAINNQMILLAIQSITGIVLYWGACFILKISSFMEVLEMIRFNLKTMNFR